VPWSTGGKQWLGKISKQGNQYLRWLLVAGAMSVILQAKRRGTTNLPWLADMIVRKPTKVAAVALANKNARIVWTLAQAWRNVSKLRDGAGSLRPIRSRRSS